MRVRVPAVILAIMLIDRASGAATPANESIVWNTPASYPHGLTSDGTHLWHVNHDTHMLYQLVPGTGAAVAGHPLEITYPRGLAWDGERLWAATSSQLHQIDHTDGQTLHTIAGPVTDHQGLTYGAGWLWVASRSQDRIYGVDPDTGAVETSFPSPYANPRGLAYRDGLLWSIDSTQDRVYRIDPSNGVVQSSFLVEKCNPRGLTWHSNRLWMADNSNDRVIGLPVVVSGSNTLATPYVHRSDHYHVLTNGTIIPYVDSHVYVALPEPNDATEILSRLSFINGSESAPDQVLTDEFGQAVADFDVGTVQPGGVVTVCVQHIVRLWDWTVNVDPALVAPLTAVDPAVTSLYCRNESKYVLHDSFIQTTAVAIVQGETNVYEQARLVHNHVAENITYEAAGGWDDAKTVLQRGTGSCSEFSFAMIALCRALGIPARFAGGSEPRSFVEGRIDTSSHRWVEVYVPGYGWAPFDANSDSSVPALQREAAAQQRGLVMRRGGGANLWLDWRYTSSAQHALGTPPRYKATVWSGSAWNDGGDFDGDGIANAVDAFPYDRAASSDFDSDGVPDTWNPGHSTASSTSVPPLNEDDDDDNDNIPDTWETRYGLNSTNAADATMHSDGDGVDNVSEYVADTDPTNAASFFRIVAASNEAARILVFLSSSNRVYTLLRTDGLTNTWRRVDDQTGVSGLGGPDALIDTNDVTDRSFYRIDVSLQ